MCISPEMFCHGCLTESFGQLLRYPVEEVKEGLRLCARHKQKYLENPQALNLRTEGGESCAVPVLSR